MTPDPAWIDDPTLSISLAAVRASIGHHAATERAEGRAPAAGPTPPAAPARRRGRKSNREQARFIDTEELKRAGKYDR